MIFHSAFVDQTDPIKGEYLKYWMGTEGLPLIEKWENTSKLTYDGDAAISKNIDIYWTLLEDEFKPKANKIISIIELWNKSKQRSASLNEWITRVYNMVDQCKYADDRDNITDRIIRDVLIVRCSSSHAKDKIIRKGSVVSLKEVLAFYKQKKVLQRLFQQSELIHRKYTMPDMTRRNQAPRVESRSLDNLYIQETRLQTCRLTYVLLMCYLQQPMCYQCGKTFTKKHDKVCKAKTAKCDSCQMVGHYSKCCIKTEKLKKLSNTRKQHIAGAHKPEDMYYDEDGNV